MMGNHNDTASGLSSPIQSNISRNDSLGGFQALLGFPGHYSFFWFFSSSAASLTETMNHCQVQTGRMFWSGFKIFILVTSFPANTALMWMLLSRRRARTPSEVLGLNVSVMDVLYCLCLPLDIYTTLHETSETTQSINEALFALNFFGCPLLLTLMCLERYLAVARPMVFIRLGRREYRVVLCACAWILTLAVGLLGYFIGVFSMALPLSITISLLFLVMLLCLLGIVAVLRQSGPGDGSGTSVPLKRRALKNILAVMVPSAVAYSPLVALVPYMAVIMSNQADTISPEQCYNLQVLLLFPNFGLFIGPMFYLSRLRQVTCWTAERQTPISKTQEE